MNLDFPTGIYELPVKSKQTLEVPLESKQTLEVPTESKQTLEVPVESKPIPWTQNPLVFTIRNLLIYPITLLYNFVSFIKELTDDKNSNRCNSLYDSFLLFFETSESYIRGKSIEIIEFEITNLYKELTAKKLEEEQRIKRVEKHLSYIANKPCKFWNDLVILLTSFPLVPTIIADYCQTNFSLMPDDQITGIIRQFSLSIYNMLRMIYLDLFLDYLIKLHEEKGITKFYNSQNNSECVQYSNSSQPNSTPLVVFPQNEIRRIPESDDDAEDVYIEK